MYVCFPLLILRSEMFPSQGRYHLTATSPWKISSVAYFGHQGHMMKKSDKQEGFLKSLFLDLQKYVVIHTSKNQKFVIKFWNNIWGLCAIFDIRFLSISTQFKEMLCEKLKSIPQITADNQSNGGRGHPFKTSRLVKQARPFSAK